MVKEAGILLRKESTFYYYRTWAIWVRIIKTSCREAWIVKFFPAIYLITQKVPKLRAVTDTTRPSASYSIVLILCLAVIGIGLLTHAYDSHGLMLVALEMSHGEIELTRLTKLLKSQ